MNSDAQTQARKMGTAAVFSRAAETYDRVGPRFFSYFGQRLVELTPLRARANVLDVATGRGAVLFPAAEKIGPEGQIVGIDLAEGMIERTSAEIKSRGVSNARVQLMDAEQLDFPDASFDFVLAGFALFFLPQVAKAVAEIYRVLKPGGVLAATSWGASDERWNWIAEVGLRPAPSGQVRRVSHDNNWEWLGPALTQAGFLNQQVISEEADFAFANADEWWASEWSHGARGCLERLQPEALEKAKAAAYAKLHAIQQPDGIHHLYRVLFGFATKPLA